MFYISLDGCLVPRKDASHSPSTSFLRYTEGGLFVNFGIIENTHKRSKNKVLNHFRKSLFTEVVCDNNSGSTNLHPKICKICTDLNQDLTLNQTLTRIKDRTKYKHGSLTRDRSINFESATAYNVLAFNLLGGILVLWDSINVNG